MATFKVVGRRSKQPGAPLLLYLRVSASKADAYVSLGVRCPAKDWNARTGRPRKTHADEPALARVCERAEAAGRTAHLAAVLDGEGHDAAAVAARARAVLAPPEPPRHDLFRWAEDVALEHDRRGGAGTAAKVRAAARALAAFHGKPTLPMDSLTPAYVKAWAAWMADGGRRVNTVASHLRTVRAVVNKARGHGLTAADPFRGVVVRTERTVKARLSPADFARLRAWHDAAPDGPVKDTAAGFLLAVYLLGARFGDVARLRPSDVALGPDGVPATVAYRMGKTGTPRDVPLAAPAAALVGGLLARRRHEAHLLPFLDGRDLSTPQSALQSVKRATAAANANLRRIAERAGIPRVSTHAARRLFGDLAVRAGLVVGEVQLLYGHGSGKVSETYLNDLDTATVARRVAGIFGP